jgi:hypothetical protein
MRFITLSVKIFVVHYSNSAFSFDGEADFCRYTVEISFDKIVGPIQRINPDASFRRIEVLEFSISDDLSLWVFSYDLGKQLLPQLLLSLQLLPVTPFQHSISFLSPPESPLRHIWLIFHVVLGILLAPDAQLRVQLIQAVLNCPLNPEVGLSHRGHVTLGVLDFVAAGLGQLPYDLPRVLC